MTASATGASNKSSDSQRQSLSRYFFSFTASTLPFKIRRLSIHNPSNAVDFKQGQLSSSDQYATEKLLAMIGPEIMNVNLAKWGSNKELHQKIVLHDLRIPYTTNTNSQVASYSTALEIVKDSSSELLRLILITGRPYSAEEVADLTARNQASPTTNKMMKAYQLGTIDPSVPLKSKISLCFEALPEYRTETMLMECGPTTCAASIPAYRNTVY